jgi:hypothetical protein
MSFLYNFSMARGWESKAIEAQQAEASEEKSTLRTKMTPQQVARKRQIDGLVLSRQRVRQQLAAAQDPRHRQMLEIAACTTWKPTDKPARLRFSSPSTVYSQIEAAFACPAKTAKRLCSSRIMRLE